MVTEAFASRSCRCGIPPPPLSLSRTQRYNITLGLVTTLLADLLPVISQVICSCRSFYLPSIYLQSNFLYLLSPHTFQPPTPSLTTLPPYTHSCTGLTHVDFIALPAKAKVSFIYQVLPYSFGYHLVFSFLCQFFRTTILISLTTFCIPPG